MRRIAALLIWVMMAGLAPPVVAADTAAGAPEWLVTGWGWTLALLADGERAFDNRDYVWQRVPERFHGWRITQTGGGVRARIQVKAGRDGTLYASTTLAQTAVKLDGWMPVPNVTFCYTDGGRTSMSLFARPVKAGEEVRLPQGNWTGTLLLLPPDARVAAQPGPAPQELERLKYRNPGLTVDLAVGLWAFPLPMDFNGDGKLDLAVSCPDKPSNGTYLFENPTGKAMPVFRPGRRISRGMHNAQISYVDGKPRVLTPGTEYPDFLRTGLDGGVKLPPPANAHSRAVRGNFWRYVDYDGDGRLDLVVGADDWTDYGWDNGFDAAGRWTRGPLRGTVYLLRNTGSGSQPVYAPAEKVMAGSQPVETYGWPSPNFADFRGTGKLDLICGEFLDGFTFYENTGTRTVPVYAPGKRLRLPGGQPLTMDLQMITPVAVDWNDDGPVDLICGDEDGRVAFIENTGRLAADGTPQFREPRYFQQEADELKCGALATPVGFDWNGDGAMDILSGNSAGYLMFFENLSKPGVERPRWAAPRHLDAGGKRIRIMAGPNGSIQGPAEAKWGYTTLSVADWDGDGLPDLLVNSIRGRVVWFRNIGTRTVPKLSEAQPVEVEWEGPAPVLAYGWLRPQGKALLTQWRTTPVGVDWNRDGLTDLVMLDHEGYLALFERAKREGKRVLLPPKRVFCNDRGQLLRLSAGIAGRSGRRKLCVVDWDGDGRLDLLINSANANLLRQVDARDGKWFFRDMGPLAAQNLEGHDVSPTVVDFNGDHIPDYLGGAEDGRFYYLRHRAEP